MLASTTRASRSSAGLLIRNASAACTLPLPQPLELGGQLLRLRPSDEGLRARKLGEPFADLVTDFSGPGLGGERHLHRLLELAVAPGLRD